MTENRTCQNCKNQFVIEPEDFNFYKKMDVPSPTWCPECRLMRRYAWRNERTLWKSVCDNCKKPVLAGYPPERKFPIFCHDCWFSDVWDPMGFAREYDFSRPFFEQWRELFGEVPRLNLFQMNAVNSPYANIVKDVKDSYLSFSIVSSEEIFYSKNIDRSRQMFDSINCTDSENCYWNMYGYKNFGVNFSILSSGCIDSSFLFDCHNCNNCFMSSNLRKKGYVFCNNQLTKEEYETKVSEFLKNPFNEILDNFEKLYKNSIHKYNWANKILNSTGSMIMNTKNAKSCFEAYDLEDTSYVGRCFGIKDCMDANNTAGGTELVYEYVSGGNALRNVKFSVAAFNALSDSSYCGWCDKSSNLFGCFGVRDRKYCILNRQYTKAEYEKLMPKVIEHMNEMPYIDKKGRVYKYGEFFPIDMSPFPFNGSVAHEHFPLSKEEIIERGYNYREPEVKNPAVDVKYEEIPNDIALVADDFVGKSIACAHAGKCVHQCTVAFKVILPELTTYRRSKFPLPRLCPNCRHYERLKYRNPWKLWHRQCMCDLKHNHHPDGRCPNEFETSYSPDRKEIVYCEQCYNAEVV